MMTAGRKIVHAARWPHSEARGLCKLDGRERVRCSPSLREPLMTEYTGMIRILMSVARVAGVDDEGPFAELEISGLRQTRLIRLPIDGRMR